MKSRSFTANTITDQKRLVRGEHYLAARARLRVRDHSHNRPWRALILAGPTPAGEIECIRELMPKAHVTAVDRHPECLEAAIEAGADDVVHCDIAEYEEVRYQHGPIKRKPNPRLASLGRFDIVNLDLCAGASEETRRLFQVNWALKEAGGVVMATFSYGRDVSEVYDATLREWQDTDAEAALSQSGVPRSVAGRVLYAFGSRVATPHSSAAGDGLRSLMLYRGGEMPMVSACFHRGIGLSFVRVEPGDFELAATHPDPAKLYATPQERIEALRRKHAAIKASYTRKATA